MSVSSKLQILHFNDVYRVTPQKVSGGTIDVTQFAALVRDLRTSAGNDGLLLFSGDVFSPSVESSVTRGSHMVPVLNFLDIDVSVAGNHDFDFGYPHLTTLLTDTTFPWLLSNIVDTTTSQVPKHLHEFFVLERAGLRIGFIGLVEEAWIATVSSWPPQFVYKSMTETALQLSKLLRDPHGEHRCDIIIALTHARLPNDLLLAKDVFALSPSGQKTTPLPFANMHGADLILGGHDHLYFVARGADDWEFFDKSEKVLGAEGDNGDVLVIKSGSDFRELSEINLELALSPEGSVRKVVISRITGKRHIVTPEHHKADDLTDILGKLLSSVASTLKAPACRTTVMLDVRGTFIRTAESPICNWFSDIVRHAYDDALCLKGCGGSDGVLLCAGTFRGDSTYGPGNITIGDIIEILPFEDPIVVLELDGKTLWDALESALSKWPSQEGRFPAISGFRVSWDSRKPPGERVLNIWLLVSSGDGVREVEVKRVKTGRKYKVVTREYMAQGHDGFTALAKGEWLIDHECGSMMSTIIRRYMLGSQFITKMIRMKDEPERPSISQGTNNFIGQLQTESIGASGATTHWKQAVVQIVKEFRDPHYQKHLMVSSTEHMTGVDAFDGSNARKGLECETKTNDVDKDLLIVAPSIDGRLKDIAKG